MPETLERNKEVIRRLLAEVDRGNLDVVETYYAPDYVDRTPPPIRGLASVGVLDQLGIPAPRSASGLSPTAENAQ